MLHLLPNELLLEVSSSIQDNKSLMSLALTHHSFCSIAHERLIRGATIPFRSIPAYIKLPDQHPQWAKSITEFELQDNKKDIDDFSCTPRELKVINDLIARLPQRRVRKNARAVFKTNPQSPQLWTALLFAALPNANAIRFAPSEEIVSEGTHTYRAFLWYQAGMGIWGRKPLLQYSQSRIQTLTVRAPSDIHDLVGISHLTNLKTLAVDGECLRSANFIGYHPSDSAVLGCTHPIRVLPSSLEPLPIYGNEWTMPWEWLLKPSAVPKFPKVH